MERERVILHVDGNAFYVSCEMAYRPELRGKAVVVGGDVEMRHGIVLAKSDKAKAAGVKTGNAIWEARALCPDLIVLPPNYGLYLRYAKRTREIFNEYTDQVEPFGLDEAWLDVTGSGILGDGKHIADEIRARFRDELGITASVGVSYNKIYAKLGSDYKKPDATTVISKGNREKIVWPLPAGDLLYVGRATQRKLYNMGVRTIGDLANADVADLRARFGKIGDVLYTFANGLDATPVSTFGTSDAIKSIGNSTTTPRDLNNNDDVKLVATLLCESIAARLREHHLRCGTIEIYVRDNKLTTLIRQHKLQRPTCVARDVLDASMALFREHYSWERGVRSLGVRGSGLESMDGGVQLSLFDTEDDIKAQKRERLATALDGLRERFGFLCIAPASMLVDPMGGQLNPKEDHIIHPVGWF